MLRSARELAVYQKAYDASLALHTLSQSLPKSEQYELASQLRRASKSVCLNLTEGFAKQSQSKAEFKRYITIAVGSADETVTCLHYVRDLGYLQADAINEWCSKYDEIIAMLIGLRNKV